MKKAFWIFTWVVLLVPFVVLSLFYDSISQEVLTYRSFGGNEI
jgi:hypothetical protein